VNHGWRYRTLRYIGVIDKQINGFLPIACRRIAVCFAFGSIGMKDLDRLLPLMDHDLAAESSFLGVFKEAIDRCLGIFDRGRDSLGRGRGEPADDIGFLRDQRITGDNAIAYCRDSVVSITHHHQFTFAACLENWHLGDGISETELRPVQKENAIAGRNIGGNFFDAIQIDAVYLGKCRKYLLGR